MGVEVDGDFGDLLEDLESFVFEVDSAEADSLELAQNAGDFAGFATQAPRIYVLTRAKRSGW